MEKFLFLMLSFLLNIYPIDILGSYQEDYKCYDYGSYQGDGYLMVYDLLSDEVYYEILYDQGKDESFIYLADVGDTIFILVEINQGQEYKILHYDHQGLLIKERVLDYEIIAFYNHHHYLVIDVDGDYLYIDEDFNILFEPIIEERVKEYSYIQYQGELLIDEKISNQHIIEDSGYHQIQIQSNDYIFFYDLIIEKDIHIIGQEYKDGYRGQIVIEEDDLLVNNKAYESMSIIDQSGLYSITYYDKNILIQDLQVKLYPEVIYYNGIDHYDLIDDLIIDEPISIFANIDDLKLNGLSYNHELISETGNYYLQAGIDTISFKIVSKVSGVENQAIYSSVELYAFGEIYLNGQAIQGLKYIKESGHYSLEVMEDGQVIESIFFTIDNADEFNENKDNIYLYIGLLLVGMVSILLLKIVILYKL
ncbi:hypothetical protein HF295_06945 [Hujiaoplasma nucleasis]|uniref:Uncharacterized protein n=1 Tax=Hujiaoplasma nucleasis TaxID=2725268 RepID=A0A7L6N343_9MOLU|nr:hypothetical protein [Hujiaoplasma nucleasis]QLY40593.1 hypothetical protein HF295_06945 [Hujiaoplasma nucleasis]